MSQDLFANSIFTKQQGLLDFLESDKADGIKVITEDPLYQLSINYYRVFVERISRQRGAWQVKMLPLYKFSRRYVGDETRSGVISGCEWFITSVIRDCKRM